MGNCIKILQLLVFTIRNDAPTKVNNTLPSPFISAVCDFNEVNN
jgi:hypothetical protein